MCQMVNFLIITYLQMKYDIFCMYNSVQSPEFGFQNFFFRWLSCDPVNVKDLNGILTGNSNLKYSVNEPSHKWDNLLIKFSNVISYQWRWRVKNIHLSLLNTSDKNSIF